MSRAITTASAAILAVGLTAASAAATTGPVLVDSCSTTIVHDSRLVADLECEEGAGITLAAGATIDLGGFTLSGAGAGAAVIVDTEDPVVIENGTISGWGVGVASSGRALQGSITVDRVHLRDNGSGVRTPFMTLSVSASTFDANQTGVTSFYGTTHISGSTFSDNGTATDFVYTRGSMSEVTFERNRLAMYCSESGIPIDRAVFVDNDQGIYKDICGFPGGVTNSRFERNGVAYRSGWTASPDELTGNTFHRNEVAVDAWAGGTVKDNTFTDNQRALVSTFVENDSKLVVQSNVFTNNGDAILIENVPASVHRNVVVNNSGWGIYAPGATDSSRNIARRNGSEPQCVGVVCSP